MLQMQGPVFIGNEAYNTITGVQQNESINGYLNNSGRFYLRLGTASID